MKTLYIQPEDKDITKDMLEDYPFYYKDGQKVYDLGYYIKNNKIYKAIYVVK